MAFVVTDAGLALEAQNVTNNVTSAIDRITLGTGNRTPTGTETALVTPFSPAKELANPRGYFEANQGSVDWEQEDDSDAYEAKEAGLWVGTTLVGYESNATGNIFVKTAGQRIVHRFLIAFARGTLTTFTFANIQNNAAATETTAGIVELADETESQITVEANQSTTKPMSVRRSWQQIAAWWGQVGRIADTMLPTRIQGIRYGTADPVNSVGVDGDIYIKLE